jgi:serine/threonine-protein kinase
MTAEGRPTVDTQGYAEVPALAGRLLPGAVLGEWRIEAQVGEGGMGTVYAAVHTVIGKRAAIKVIRNRLHADLHAAERFLQEARVVNQVGHPNIVDIFQLGRLDDGRPYLVMELLQGATLGERLDLGRVPVIEAIDILLQVCAALSAAHASGVIHRDLQPDNIFLAEQRGATVVKLVDWGIAKMKSRPADAVEVTGAGTMVGTPRYIAPEQARGQNVDELTDVYSLGAIAHELFLEAPVFSCDNVADLLVAHLREPVSPPRDVWPDMPARLERLLLAMLEKEQTARPSVAEIVTELELVKQELGEKLVPALAVGSGPVRITGRHAMTPARVSGTEPTCLSDAEPEPAPRTRRTTWSAGVAAAMAVVAAIGFTHALASSGPVAPKPAIEASAATSEPASAELPAAVTPSMMPAAPAVTGSDEPTVRIAPASAPTAEKARHRRHKHHRSVHPDATIDPFQ